MSTKTASVIGATGMIGTYLLEQLLTDSYFDTIRVIVRRPFEKKHPKLEVRLVDFTDYESLKLAIDGSDSLFCAIGTTQKKVKGDKGLYRKVDFDIPVRAARICKETDCTTLVMVSAIGANNNSRNFYLHLKGETEEAIEQNGPASIHIIQPAQLLGKRKENRPIEKLFMPLGKMLSPLLAGSLSKYKPIHAKEVAAAMITAAKTKKKGVYRYTYREIKQLAEQKQF